MDKGHAIDTERLVSLVLENGGATVEVIPVKDGSILFREVVPEQGYAVGGYAPTETFDLHDFCAELDLLVYVTRNLTDALKNGEHYFGLWIDGGTLYLDVSRIINDLPDALAEGRRNGEIAIWDFRNADSINC